MCQLLYTLINGHHFQQASIAVTWVATFQCNFYTSCKKCYMDDINLLLRKSMSALNVSFTKAYLIKVLFKIAWRLNAYTPVPAAEQLPSVTPWHMYGDIRKIMPVRMKSSRTLRTVLYRRLTGIPLANSQQAHTIDYIITDCYMFLYADAANRIGKREHLR